MHTTAVAFDEYDDVEASVQLLLDVLGKAEENDAYWKHILIFTYLALQGAAVCCLTRSDATGPFDKRTERELRLRHLLDSQKATNHNHGAPWIMPDMDAPKEKLASFDELLDRLPSSLRIQVKGKTVQSASDSEVPFVFVRQYRNECSHFTPETKIIGKNEIARHCKACLEHTLKIVGSPELFASRSRFDETRVKQNLQKVIALLREQQQAGT